MNPFLDPTSPPHWENMTPEHIRPAIQESIKEGQSKLEQIKEQNFEKATYQTTFGALEAVTDSLYRAWGRLNHLDSVSNNSAQREALNEMLPLVTQFTSNIPLDAELWALLKAVKENPVSQELEAIYKRHMEETCASFINAGANLVSEKKERFAAIQAELTQKTQKFSENVLDSTNAWELTLIDASRLEGLPQSALNASQADALAHGQGTEETPSYRFTLQHPSLLPIMQYADEGSLRKEFWEANQEVGRANPYDNSLLAKEIIALRHEKAKLLGYESFADWATSRRMASTGETALEFIEKLHERVKPLFDQEVKELQEYKAQKTETSPGPLAPWETTYWSERRRKEHYDYDEEELRPYFPLTRVMSGMFQLASQLFKIQIIEANAPSAWHKEVRYYLINDQQTGETLGSFYADWHPREVKRGGAWMNCLETGLPPTENSPRIPHLGLICGNMSKPIGDSPALMTHNEVLTIFHEFGHLIHQLLSEVKVKALSGTNVAWDFVELPSQLMENFCWTRESLDFFALHYETEAPIPESLYQKMLSARNYMSATSFMRQLAFAKLDLELHHRSYDLSSDWETLEQEILSSYVSPLSTRQASMVRRFSHLFASSTGYAAGYYSYKWAEVLDADAFTRFQEEGVLSPIVGMHYRETILAQGNAAPPETLFKNFMKRPASQNALLKREGLL